MSAYVSFVTDTITKEPALITIIITTICVTSVSICIAPLLFKRAIDGLLLHGADYNIYACFFAYIASIAISKVGGDIRVMYGNIFYQKINVLLSKVFVNRVLDMKEDFFIKNNAVRIYSVLSTANNGSQLMLQLLVNVVIPGIIETTLSIAIVMMVINSYVACSIVVYGVIYIFVTARWQERLSNAYKEAMKLNYDSVALLGNAIHAAETLRFFDGKCHIMKKYSDTMNCVNEKLSSFHKMKAAVASTQAISFVLQLTFAIIFVLMGYNKNTFSVGDIALLVMVVAQLNRPFELLAVSIKDINQASVMLAPALEVLTATSTTNNGADSVFPKEIRELRFENATYYRGERKIIDIQNISIKSGKLTFIVGETGIGKTTLFKLLLAAIKLDGGRIVINDTDISMINTSDLYHNMSIVPQDIYLLNDTVEYNITFGRQFDVEDIEAVIRMTCLEELIKSLPDGIKTLIGEKGARLSGGERQRLAIARALIGKPKILLLDEASSSIDYSTEAAIMRELRSLVDDVLILAITHRRELIDENDNVIEFIGNGCVREDGRSCAEVARENRTAG